MNTQTGAVSPFEAHVTDPVVIPASRRFYWSLRRELWETRSLYLAPLAVAALFLVAFLIGAIRPQGRMHFSIAVNDIQHQAHIADPYTVVAFLLMGTAFVVAVFYCLEALHGERSDRSILFWKSLPVSDLTTVLSKAAIPLVLLPLLTFAITALTQLIMALMSGAVLRGSGLSVAALWSHVPMWQMALML